MRSLECITKWEIYCGGIILALLLLAHPCWADEKPLNERLQAGSSIPDILKRRDPFQRPTNPFLPVDIVRPQNAPITASAPRPQQSSAVDESAPEIERYNADNYRLVAILLGDIYPRALVRSPGNKVYVVREKDRIGNRKGRIRAIKEGGLVVVEELRLETGAIKRSEVLLEMQKAKDAT